VRDTKCKHHITLTTVTFLRFVMFTFWNYNVLKLLRLETITFSDAMLSGINVVLCYVLAVPLIRIIGGEKFCLSLTRLPGAAAAALLDT
jgi:hypothetical protein